MGSSSMGSTSASQGGTTGGAATTTASAQLRAGLDELLREHVDLTGFAVQTAVTDGISSNNTAQALKAVNANTLALGKAIGSVYGQAAQKQFDKIWSAHIGFFVSYTKGLATHNQQLVNKSQKQLAGYKKDFSTFVASATGLPGSAVATDLQGHIQTLETAIKAIVTKSPTAGAALQMAATHMDGTADVLAKGIATQKKLPGNVDGAASALRAGLTGLLIQHVAQTAQVVQTAVETSLTSKQTAASVKALDQNTVELGKAIGSVYGQAAQKQFDKIWRAHIGFFVNYTKGLATNDQALVSKSQKQLAGYKKDFAKFIGGATGLPAAAVATDLQGHIQTLEAAIKAIVTKSPNAAAKTSAAESHMAGTAAVLAKGIAAQKHLS
jgi:predicted oxidoreductase (fatty acid repression mutant protein)